jgi:hypothetical protein
LLFLSIVSIYLPPSRASTILRELLLDTNTGKLDPKVAIAHKIKPLRMKKNQNPMESRVLTRARSRMIERLFLRRSRANRMGASS